MSKEEVMAYFAGRANNPEARRGDRLLRENIIANNKIITQSTRIAELEARIYAEDRLGPPFHASDDMTAELAVELAQADKRITELELALARLIGEANNGVWHLSSDCDVEGRDDCKLCATIDAAWEVLNE